MFRLLKFLPVVIPIVQKLLRQPKVREFLKLKPLAPETAQRGRRGRRR